MHVKLTSFHQSHQRDETNVCLRCMSMVDIGKVCPNSCVHLSAFHASAEIFLQSPFTLKWYGISVDINEDKSLL